MLIMIFVMIDLIVNYLYCLIIIKFTIQLRIKNSMMMS